MINFDETGRLVVICGPMFCGKSEELIRRLTRYQIAEKSIGLYKPLLDDREFDSRSGLSYNVDCTFVKDTEELRKHYRAKFHDSLYKSKIDVLALDEAQFFDDELVSWVYGIRQFHGSVNIIVSGLDKDFNGKPFGPMPGLLAMADEVVKLTAICMKCKKQPANFTYRKGDDREQIVVGDKDIYEARCYQCWRVV